MLDCEKDVIFYGIELNKLDDTKTSVFSETNIKIGLRITRSLKIQKTENIEKILAEKSLTVPQLGLDSLIS